MADIHDHPTSEFWQYFRQRGLNDADVANLGAELVPNGQIPGLLPGNPYAERWPGNAVRIPYVDINGMDTGAYLLRLIGKQPTFAKIPKALFPSKVKPRAHFPRSNPQPEKGMVVYLCESVIKAEIVAKCGFYAIGVNGCWGFRDRNSQDKLLADIRELPWSLISEIRVFFDSNYLTNDNVKAGVSDFALRCHQVLGFQEVRVCVLPPAPGGEDWGCDDAFVAMGGGWLCDLLEGPTEEPELNELGVKLHELNQECCILMETGQIVQYNVHPVIPMAFSSFTNVNYASWQVMGDDEKRKSVPRVWLGWEGANKVPRAVLKPNEPKMVPGKFLNLWVDPAIPAGEPSALWAEFLENLIPDEVGFQWLTQWIGHLVQRPGIKMSTYPILVGPQGVGKSLIGQAVCSILGRENTMSISQDDIESTYNGLHAVKLFTVIDEFYARDQGVGNKLKKLVTEKVTVVNPKYGRQFTVESVCNYMITTNELAALKLDEDDRRAGVVDCTPNISFAGDIDYFAPLFEMVERNPSGILGYFMHVDLQGFSPYGTAPTTDAKRDMTEQRRTGYEEVAWRLTHDKVAFLEELNLDPDVNYISLSLLGVKVQNMVGHQAQIYDRAMSNKLNAALRKMGWLTYAGNSTGQVRVNGQKHRIYCAPGSRRDVEETVLRDDVTKWLPKVSR